MSKMEKWLYNQRPDLKKNVKIVSGVKWLHISQDPSVKEMIPRIGWRQTQDEDRTTPRISGAETLRGCIYGHSNVRCNIINGQNFNKDNWSDGLPIFHIYEVSDLDFLLPNNKLVPEADVSKELWIVPYCPEALVIKPKRIGRMIPYEVSSIMSMGKWTESNSFYIECNETITLDDDTVLLQGKYRFDIDGQLDPFNKKDVSNIKNVVPITNAQWSLAMKTLKKECT